MMKKIVLIAGLAIAMTSSAFAKDGRDSGIYSSDSAWLGATVNYLATVPGATVRFGVDHFRPQSNQGLGRAFSDQAKEEDLKVKVSEERVGGAVLYHVEVRSGGWLRMYCAEEPGMGDTVWVTCGGDQESAAVGARRAF